MTKIAVTTDWHLTNSHSKSKLDDNGVSDFLRAQDKFSEFFAIDSRDCDIILHLGDFTDRVTLDPITHTYFNRSVKYLIDERRPTIIIEGNHCLSDKNGMFTVLSAVGELVDMEDFHIVVEDEMIQIKDNRFYCVPYRKDYKAIEESISEINNNLDTNFVNILLFHLPTTNALLDNGLQSVGGVNLSKDITDNFDICLGGDFHTPQQLVGNDNAYYIGAPFSMKMNDVFERGYWKVDIDKSGYEIEKVQNPYNYNITTLSSEQFLDYIRDNEDILSRTIVKVDSEPSQELLEAISQHKSKFYSLTVGKRTINTNKTDVAAVEMFSHSQDLDVIEKELKALTDDVALQANAVKLFELIVVR
jgi:DNA repair exonuclease SbcCD nuclease subunit